MNVTEQQLIAAGWKHTHLPETFKDVGDAERGPKLIGNPAAEMYTKEDRYYIFVDGVEIASGVEDVSYTNIPF